MQAPGEKLAEKMWETLFDKGIAAILRPFQMRRVGSAALEVKQEEIIGIALAETQAAMIRAQQPMLVAGGETTAVHPSPVRLIQSAADAESNPRRLILQAAAESGAADVLRRELNVARAAVFADQDLRQLSAGNAPDLLEPEIVEPEIVEPEIVEPEIVEPEIVEPEIVEPSRDFVDSDWLYRWRDAASEVSQEELQRLWGRILAGEVRTPGAFSLRTLEFLRNISAEEAEKIAQLARFVAGGFIFKSPSGSLSAAGFNMTAMLGMQHLGLIAGVDGIGLKCQMGSSKPDVYELAVPATNRVLLLRDPNPVRIFAAPGYPITNLGKQVFRLSRQPVSEEYLTELGMTAKADGFQVWIGDCVAATETNVQCANLNEL
ncbi:hypothetical protein tb265_38940 [Gemmatimonadetes bacterium T265]|nr:hypothetical protein tb265_38940 [Gemmatimonadetes bacterium T265]